MSAEDDSLRHLHDDVMDHRYLSDVEGEAVGAVKYNIWLLLVFEGEEDGKTNWYLKVNWLLYTISTTSVALATILFWTLNDGKTLVVSRFE